MKTKLDDKFYDSLTEWNGLKTSKVRLERGEIGDDIGFARIAVLMYKQAELYLNSPEFKNLMKNLDI